MLSRGCSSRNFTPLPSSSSPSPLKRLWKWTEGRHMNKQIRSMTKPWNWSRSLENTSQPLYRVTHWKRFITKSNKSLRTSLGTTFGSHPLKNSEESPPTILLWAEEIKSLFPPPSSFLSPRGEQMTTVLVPFFRYVQKLSFLVLFCFFKFLFCFSLILGWCHLTHHVTVPMPAWTFPKH